MPASLVLALTLLALAAGARPGYPGVGYTPRTIAGRARRLVRRDPLMLVLGPVRVLAVAAVLVMWSALRVGTWGLIAAIAVAAAVAVLVGLTLLGAVAVAAWLSFSPIPASRLTAIAPAK